MSDDVVAGFFHDLKQMAKIKPHTGLSLGYDLTCCLQNLSNYETVVKELKGVKMTLKLPTKTSTNLPL